MRFLLSVWFAAACFAEPPQRIVSTAPSFTETVFALGYGAKVVGVSTYCHFPAEVDRLPRVGSYLKPNIEAIARLRPDLVLVHKEQKESIRQLTALGLRVLPLKNTNLDDTLQSIRETGAALEVPAKAAELERTIQAKLEALAKRVAGRPARSLLFVVGRTPGRLDGLIAVGKGSFLNELIKLAGGRNALFDSPVTYPRISLEAVVRLDPDVIVDMGDMAETQGVSEAHKRSVVQLWREQPAVRAPREGHAFAVAADIFVVPGPRIAEAAEAFARMLHGDSLR